MDEHNQYQEPNQELYQSPASELNQETVALSSAPASGQSFLEKVACWLVIVMALGALLFFLPVATSPFYLTKALAVYLPTLLVLILFALNVIRRGVLPKGDRLLSLGALAVGLVFILSAFFGLSWKHSIIGYGFEVGSAAFWLTMLLLTYAISALFRANERIFYLFLAMFVAVGLILLWLIARLILGVELLSFGIFNALSDNPIGNWNDLGVISALVVLLSNSTIQLLKPSKKLRFILLVVMYLSLAVLLVVNYPLVFKLLALLTIGLLYLTNYRIAPPVETYDQGTSLEVVNSRKKLSVHSLVIIVVSLAFVFLPSTLTNRVPSALGISYLEVRPAWSSTLGLYTEAIASRPLLGVGGNNFFSLWATHKPADINLTNFWPVDFNYAVGLLPTIMIVTGLLGTVAILILLAGMLKMAVKTWQFRPKDRLTGYLATSTFLGALLLWLTNVFYVPTFSVVFLSFVFLGLWLAVAFEKGIVKAEEIILTKHKIFSVSSVFLAVIFILGSGVFGYILVQKHRAAMLLQQSVVTLTETDDIGQAETLVLEAISLDPQDIYYRSLSELILLRLNMVVLANGGRVTDDIVPVVQELINATVGSANEAINLRPNDYNNHLFLARVYGSFVPGGLPGAYEKAREVYDRAISINPNNPGIYLELARLELNHNDREKARTEINRAIAVKPNYTEAIFLLSQIEVAEGNVPEAISSVESAISTAPNNPALYFQLGLLHYNQNNYQLAQTAFGQAVNIVPDYANAKYFLGLSYYQLEDNNAAIAQFEEIQATNPDNAEVEFILENLRAGREPFAEVLPPLDDSPEDREVLPIDESLEVDDLR